MENNYDEGHLDLFESFSHFRVQCPECGNHLEVYDYLEKCLECGYKIISCPICRSAVCEEEYEYKCCDIACGYVFAICPKCCSIATPYGSYKGLRQFKCSNEKFHQPKVYRFVPVTLYRKERRQKAEQLAMELKMENNKLTIREIAMKLDDLLLEDKGQQKYLRYPLSTVGRWVQPKHKRKSKPAIEERLNIQKKMLNAEKYFRCRAIRAMEQGHENDFLRVCEHCNKERVKKNGRFCILDMACPKCHSFEFNYYGRLGGKTRVQCRQCKTVYWGKCLE